MKLKQTFLFLLLLILSGCSFLSNERIPAPTPAPPTVSAPAKPLRRIFHDTLALQHKDFPAAAYNRFLPEHSGFGILDYAFGSSLTPVRLLLSNPNTEFFRVHFINGPGVNNNKAASYEITAGLTAPQLDNKLQNKDPKILNYLRTRVGLFCDLIPQYPSVEFALSPVLEGRLSQASWRVVNEVVLASCDKPFYLVNSPLGNYTKFNGVRLETHGNHPKAGSFISSLDGVDVSDISISQWLSDTQEEAFTGVWGRSSNCRNQGNWQDPRHRTSCPDSGLVEELIHITNNKGPIPQLRAGSCKSVRPFVAPLIGKPTAEDKGTPDERKNRPVMIVKWSGNRGDSISIIDSRGHQIGKLGYYGTYSTPGFYRWYSKYSPGTGLHGYTYEKLAVQSSGSPYTWLKRKSGECLGPMLLGQRQGQPYSK